MLQEVLKSKLEELKGDPELKDVLQDIEENGQGAMARCAVPDAASLWRVAGGGWVWEEGPCSLLGWITWIAMWVWGRPRPARAWCVRKRVHDASR